MDVARITLCLLVLVTTGCFRSTLPPLEHPPEAQRLLNVPDALMTLRIQVEAPRSSVGNQFVLGVVPLTRVYAPHLERDAATHLALEAAMRRYKLIPEGTQTDAKYPHLTVIVKDVRISGYDLIFVRRPSASLTLSGTLELPNHAPRVCEATAESSELTKFAFSSELNAVLQESFTTSARELFDCLRL